jgi:hypothetical protein
MVYAYSDDCKKRQAQSSAPNSLILLDKSQATAKNHNY